MTFKSICYIVTFRSEESWDCLRSQLSLFSHRLSWHRLNPLDARFGSQLEDWRCVRVILLSHNAAHVIDLTYFDSYPKVWGLCVMCWPAVKSQTKKFVEEEISNITMPEMRGSEGRFQYTIKKYVLHIPHQRSWYEWFYNICVHLYSVKITELDLTSDLRFHPEVGLIFEVHNSSITLNFQRKILYWLL